MEEDLKELRESGSSLAKGRARRVGSRSLSVAALGVLLAVGLTDAPEAVAAPGHVRADTIRTGHPFHFRKTVFFNTEYLARAAESAKRAEPEASATRAAEEPTKGEDRAATYARRYGITRDLAQTILDVALAEGLDPELGFRMIRVESRFKPSARGPHGALGLTQLMPSTARSLDRSLKTESEIMDPRTNLRIGFRYLRKMIERYDGNVRLGLLAYNRGEGAVDRALRNGRDPENGYSRKVLGGSYKGQGVVDRKAKK